MPVQEAGRVRGAHGACHDWKAWVGPLGIALAVRHSILTDACVTTCDLQDWRAGPLCSG